MKSNGPKVRKLSFGSVLPLLAVVAALSAIASVAAHPFPVCPQPQGASEVLIGNGSGPSATEVGGRWYWLRSPDEEKRVVIGIFNRYCIRCHGVDGRGIWDIPGVPNFANTGWQASRSDDQLVRIILEGRGAVMPPFRGAVSLEEAWAMARHLRSFVPGSGTPRPDFDKQSEKPANGQPKPEAKPATPSKEKESNEPKKSEAKQPVTFRK